MLGEHKTCELREKSEEDGNVREERRMSGEQSIVSNKCKREAMRANQLCVDFQQFFRGVHEVTADSSGGGLPTARKAAAQSQTSLHLVQITCNPDLPISLVHHNPNNTYINTPTVMYHDVVTTTDPTQHDVKNAYSTFSTSDAPPE